METVSKNEDHFFERILIGSGLKPTDPATKIFDQQTTNMGYL